MGDAVNLVELLKDEDIQTWKQAFEVLKDYLWILREDTLSHEILETLLTRNDFQVVRIPMVYATSPQYLASYDTRVAYEFLRQKSGRK